MVVFYCNLDNYKAPQQSIVKRRRIQMSSLQTSSSRILSPQTKQYFIPIQVCVAQIIDTRQINENAWIIKRTYLNTFIIKITDSSSFVLNCLQKSVFWLCVFTRHTRTQNFYRFFLPTVKQVYSKFFLY